MKSRVGMLLGFMGAFLLLFIGVVSHENTKAAEDPANIVMNECTVCHDLTRVCDALGEKDRDAWNKTVSRMVDNGASVASEDIPAVAEYLAALSPGSPPVCKE